MGTCSSLRRRIMMVGKALPYDAEVEYLESSGTQYLNLGIIGASGMTFEADAMWTNLSGVQVLCGAKGSRTDSFTTMFGKFNDFYASQFGYLGYTQIGTPDTNRHLYTSKINNSGGDVGIDGNIAKKTYGLYLADVPIYLFCRNNNGVAVDLSHVKLYSCKIKNNESFILDLIPVRVGQVGYMYDKVSGQLFGNAGTGSFILGPDV